MDELQALIDQAVRAQEQGDFAGAERSLKEALSLNPSHAEALNDLGRLQLAQGRAADAVVSFHRALEINPDLGQAHFNLAGLLRERGETTTALSHYARACQLLPTTATAFYHLGVTALAAEMHSDAILAMRRAAELAPTTIEPALRLAEMLTEVGQFDESLRWYDRVIELDPHHLGAWLTSGCVHEALGHADDAIICFRKALSINPSQKELHLKLGNLFLECGQPATALEAYDQAVAASPEWPEARYRRSEALFQQGRLAEAWADFEYRRGCTIGPWLTHHLANWDGEAARSKVVLAYGEQGIAHEVMLASCLPDLIGEVRHAVIECDPRLVNLFERSFPYATVVASTPAPVMFGGERAAGIDCQIAMGSLPRRYRSKYRFFPEQARYLTVDPAAADEWSARMSRLDDGMRIGLARADDGEGKHPTTAAWAELASVTTCQWIDLCPAEPLAEHVGGPSAITDCSDLGATRDLDSLAALCSSLDLVIATDHYTAHLAAAVGTPVWVLLPEATDWRWKLDERFCPWHPKMRLFRKTPDLSWRGLAAQARRELLQHLMLRRETRPKLRIRRDAA